MRKSFCKHPVQAAIARAYFGKNITPVKSAPKGLLAEVVNVNATR